MRCSASCPRSADGLVDRSASSPRPHASGDRSPPWPLIARPHKAHSLNRLQTAGRGAGRPPRVISIAIGLPSRRAQPIASAFPHRRRGRVHSGSPGESRRPAGVIHTQTDGSPRLGCRVLPLVIWRDHRRARAENAVRDSAADRRGYARGAACSRQPSTTRCGRSRCPSRISAVARSGSRRTAAGSRSRAGPKRARAARSGASRRC
jgi:hypothetical protein